MSRTPSGQPLSRRPPDTFIERQRRSAERFLADIRTCITTFDAKAREMVKAGASAEAIVAELKKILPARSQGEWMLGANVSGRYLGK